MRHSRGVATRVSHRKERLISYENKRRITGSTEGLAYALRLPRSAPHVKSRAIGAFVSSSRGTRSQQVLAYGRGRVCGAPDCGTVLSTYNPALFCSLHDVVGIPRRRS